MESIYTTGQYLETTQTWHEEDSPWKARQIAAMISRQQLAPATVAEVGCGAGLVLHELSSHVAFQHAQLEGYDISPQAIRLAAARQTRGNLRYFCADLFSQDPDQPFDLLLAIDVFEHVPDYLGFLRACRQRARSKIYHIPLDLSVSSVLRNSFLRGRYGLGHLHYFTAESALAALSDTGHRIIEHCYTNAAFDLFWLHPSLRKALASVPRWLVSRASSRIAARLFGGYSLLVLAQ